MPAPDPQSSGWKGAAPTAPQACDSVHLQLRKTNLPTRTHGPFRNTCGSTVFSGLTAGNYAFGSTQINGTQHYNGTWSASYVRVTHN